MKTWNYFPRSVCCPPLTYLYIYGLPNLKSLDNKGLQHLVSLKKSRIQDCPSLQSLTRSVIQHLISLKELQIYSCPRLQSLTEAGLHHLTTLETLDLYKCPKLQYLTKERLPNSLFYLSVFKCPSLEQQCQFEKRKEWPFISRIPKIFVVQFSIFDVVILS